MCATVVCSVVLCLLGAGKSLYGVVSSPFPAISVPPRPGLGLQLLSALSPGSLDAEVTQTPGHLIKGEGQNAKMSCVPEKGHRYVYWYQQIPAKEFKFLVSFQDKNVLETEMPKNRFLAEYPPNSPCSLEIQGAEPQDSATYLCASSEPTPLNISSALCTNSPWPGSGSRWRARTKGNESYLELTYTKAEFVASLNV